MNSLEIKDKQSQLVKRCQEIVDLCKVEVREMTEDEEKEFNDCKEEIKSLKEELKNLEEKLSDYEDNKPNTTEDNKEEKNTRNNTIMENTTKFSLVKELRNAYETGKKINLAEIRAYTVNDEGEDVVQTDIFDIWEPLRAQNVLVNAGAKYISGIKNNVQIPLMGAVSVNFAGETAAAEDGSATITSKTLSPKRITAKYPVSLELLAQDSVGIENAIREDIIKAVSAKLEETLLSDGAGDATKPAGIFNNKSLTAITSFKDITGLEATVEGANVYGECKYIVSPSAKGDLRSMNKSAKTTQLVMEKNEIDGTPVLSTTHVKDKNIVYGDFSNLVIATWDNVQIDVVRDVASVGNGQVTIVVNAYVDAAVIRDSAFAFGTTATA